MRRILEIRLERQKPKLNDLLKMFEGRDLNDPKDKEALRKKMLSLYEEQEGKNEENHKYIKLMDCFDRINKVLGYQLTALNKIDKRINNLINRKSKKNAPHQS